MRGAGHATPHVDRFGKEWTRAAGPPNLRCAHHQPQGTPDAEPPGHGTGPRGGMCVRARRHAMPHVDPRGHEWTTERLGERVGELRPTREPLPAGIPARPRGIVDLATDLVEAIHEDLHGHPRS